MTRGVVLGGGGPVGIGWEAGLLLGLIQNGVDVRNADRVIGTSAGSIVGFALSAGMDLATAPSLVRGASRQPKAEGAAATSNRARPGFGQLVETIAQSAAGPEAAERARAELGRMALASDTIPEDRWVDTFSAFASRPWPDSFGCTAVSASTGAFRVWDQGSGVDPQLALASSCAVPGVFPSVTIGDDRWMDGGARDLLNADVATGCERVLVVSCVLVDIPAASLKPPMDAFFGSIHRRIDGLRLSGSQVEVVGPDQEMLEVSGLGTKLMDATRTADAYEAGLRQGKVEAARLQDLWS